MVYCITLSFEKYLDGLVSQVYEMLRKGLFHKYDYGIIFLVRSHFLFDSVKQLLNRIYILSF